MDASLKQRLIGAAVLVLLAVIFLPLLVKGPAPESGVSGVSLNIPPEPKEINGVVTQDLPLAVPGAVPAGGAAGMPAAVQAPASEPAADAAVGDAEDVPLAAVAAGDFAVSFGSYATTVDAEKVIAALKGVGLPAYQETVTLGSRQAQRVRIGPFADQAMAESARLRAGRVRSDLDTKVIALNAETASSVPLAEPAKPEKVVIASKPIAAAEPKSKPALASELPAKPAPPAAKPAPAPVAATKPEPAPAKPANPSGTGFVVQIGAFTSSADAMAQRDALRKAGFNAFTDTVSGASGSLTRVRVGPVMTRDEADALKAKLSTQAGKDGQVRPHP